MQVERIEQCPNTFTCRQCGGTFHKRWSDEERDAEMRQNFGELQPEERVVVCDDCFPRIMAWAREQGLL